MRLVSNAPIMSAMPANIFESSAPLGLSPGFTAAMRLPNSVQDSRVGRP
jgi:hypothetical protein